MAMLTFLSLCLLSTCMADITLVEHGYLKIADRDGQMGLKGGVADESSYDHISRILYVVGSSSGVLNVVSLADIDSPTVLQTYILDISTDGSPLDVQVCRFGSRNYYAVAFGQGDPTKSGHVTIYNLFDISDTGLKPIWSRIAVGVNPDNIKFTSDCTKLVVSNEGIPAVVAGEFIDPEGSIDILEIPELETSNIIIHHRNFQSFDESPTYENLLAAGVRYMVRVNPSTSLINPLSRNIEPEYIAISPDDQHAFITLQENNAIVKINLINNTISDVYAMGSKPFAQSTMDGSDQDGSPDINMKRRTVHGLYQPDKIVFLEWGGKSYLITADEGKTYSNPSAGLLDNARGASLVANDDLDVDADLLAELTDNAQLGRTFISTVDRISLSQKITKIHTFGGRGFSIFDADTLERQWESGDMIEKMSRWYYPDVFNSGYSAPNLTPTGERDSRSTLMGPELNSVAVANFQGRTVLIFGSGANGQIYVFQVQGSVKTQVDPEFQSVHRRGSTDGTWDNLQTRSEAGDIGIADLIVIDQVDSNIPGTPVLIVVSEVTGTVSTYTFADTQFGSCTAPTLRQQQPVSLNHHERKQPHV